jgi:hypothetical protein
VYRALMFSTRLPSSLIRAARKMTRARSCDGAHGRHDVGMLALDARGDLGQAPWIERLAGQRIELAAQTRAQAVARQAAEIDGFDDGAVARLDVLGACRLPGRGENEDEEE